MSPTERFGPKFPHQQNRIDNRSGKQEFVPSWDKLWRGEALEIAQSIVIKKCTRAPFILESRHLPFNNEAPSIDLSNLRIHVRSRYAHIGLDVSDGFELDKEIISIINHSARPVELPKGARPLHFYLVPPAAYIKGEGLESIVGNEAGKAVCIQGAEEKDWRMDYETKPTGERLATGFYLKIDPKERFWIPPSEEPIRLPDEEKTTFQDIRKFLFANVLKKIDDPELPMPKNGMWIGRVPHLTLSPNIYVELDNETYIHDNGKFHKVGLQTHSPLLEGGRTNHHPHVEIRGPANWVRATVVRNGEIAKPG